MQTKARNEEQGFSETGAKKHSLENQSTSKNLSRITTSTSELPMSHKSDFKAVESLILAEIESGKIPSVAFSIAKNGKIVHENAFGWADKEQQIASTNGTPYPLASASKPIVATAMMMLHQRGTVDIQAPARHYASSWFSHQASASSHSDYSLRQLLNHTSGLGTYARIYWHDQDLPVQNLSDSFRKYGLVAQLPGTVFEYSNLGYGLIGHIIEEQTGTSLADFLKAEIFEPLGMINSIMVDSFSSPIKVAKKYDASGLPLIETYNDTPGAGNMFASAHDLTLFGLFHLSNKAEDSLLILSRKNKLLMQSFVEPGARYSYYNSSHYGLGWYSRTNSDGKAIVWHEGGMPGASAIIVLLPEQDIVASVVINATDANPQAQAFANALIQVVEPTNHSVSFDATEGFKRYTNQTELLGRWEGRITLDGNDLPWVLTFEPDGSLCAEFPQRTSGSLLPEQVKFPALLNEDMLVATFATTLPASDVAQIPNGYVLLRLLRQGDELSGAAIAYSSIHRLEHLLPFRCCLQRKTK
ncbi:MAG: beta-lactamase family protein [Candidatus Sabulitectum sp.]|nr:beta-lactamase family protein [Candidatus Sabulitectum sp.]